MKTLSAGALALLCPALLFCQATPAPVVRFHTNVGDIDVTLIPVAAPNTVANFLRYADRGDFNNSVIHRSVRSFIIQGGGYQLKDHKLVEIKADDPVRNEYSISNVRGTLAMAKLDGDPNSATNQWFFNIRDNTKTLNFQNGGFTVFGRVTAATLPVLDAMEDVPIYNNVFSSPFDQIPLINYTSGTPADENYLTIYSVTQLGAQLGARPAISAGGIVTAGNFGAFPAAAGGTFIEIYGTNLAGTSREWSGADFVNGNAPTVLDDVSVTVGGQPAYVYYVSPGQVNVQVPAGVPSGDAVPVVVTYKTQASPGVPVAMKPTAGGLYAPPGFSVGGRQFVAAIHAATGALVSNGSVPGVAAAPAVAGETLIFYGIGFGAVTPGDVPVAGQIVKSPASVAIPVQFKFGSVAAEAASALVTGSVGLYQFNVVVPRDVPSGDVALTVSQGGEALAQTLYISLK